MEPVQFIEMSTASTLFLFIVGFVGGMVSGFIGSGGAFVLTPAMMTMGVPAIVAVASNMAHKFPKALVGAYKRNKYGQVDIKLGIILGIFAEIGVLIGKNVMVGIRASFGAVGTNLYVSFVFVVVLAIVGGIVLKDGIREKRKEEQKEDHPEPEELPKLTRWVRQLHIPGTMLHFKSIDAKVSFLVLAPLGMATGMLAATIAVGGFIGVPSMMYFVGLPALMASATELVIAFVMGLGGSILYAMEGAVDIRLSMIILAGSLFGIQIGAIGTTYVKDYIVKFVMAVIMLLVLLSRFFYIPGYLSQLGKIAPMNEGTIRLLNQLGDGTLGFALLFGAIMILHALFTGIRAYNQTKMTPQGSSTLSQLTDIRPLTSVDRFDRVLVASDNSEFSASAVREAFGIAKQCAAEVHVMSLIASGAEYGGLGEPILKKEIALAQAHLDDVHKQATSLAIPCQTHVIHGQHVDQEIIAAASLLKADLIVMGRRGRRGLAHMMLGHATANVMGKSPINVLVVPRAAHVEGRHFILATDGSRHADKAVITVGQLANHYKAPVTVVSVIEAGDRPEQRTHADTIVQRAVDYLQSKNVTTTQQIMTGRPDAGIIQVAQEKDADLIIVGSHGLTGLERILIGSTTERILNGTSTAVLVIKGG